MENIQEHNEPNIAEEVPQEEIKEVAAQDAPVAEASQ